MPCHSELRFVRDLLENMSIHSCILENPEDKISEDIDLGLRALLFQKRNYRHFLTHSMREAHDNVIYRFVDEYRCCYLFMRLPDTVPEQYFYVGPYLLELPDEDFILKKVMEFNLPDEQVKQYRKYYLNLPLIDDENRLLIIINTLGKYLWGGSEQFRLMYLSETFKDDIDPAQLPESYVNAPDTPFHLRLLEEHYASERKLMDAVAQGQLLNVAAVNSSVYNQGTEQRLPDSLRNRKNYLIILNTLLRKAAENGGVHPLHIDRLSSLFAQRIESLVTIRSSIELQKEMIHKYCLLVQNYSLSHYSTLMGRAITLIEYDLTTDLTLSSLAERLEVNSSYLSSLFRREMHCTLTEFVNRKRIEHAVFLLNTTNHQIQSIANECGIQDANYFVKLFKKHVGMSPSQYRKRIE